MYVQRRGIGDSLSEDVTGGCGIGGEVGGEEAKGLISSSPVGGLEKG